MVTGDLPSLSITRQCELLSLNRSGWYYQPKGNTEEELGLMKLIDRIYLEIPFYGSKKIADQLRKLGRRVNRKRVQRLMRLMGIRAIYRRPKTSKPGRGHKIYPYLLKDLEINRPNHVWELGKPGFKGKNRMRLRQYSYTL